MPVVPALRSARRRAPARAGRPEHLSALLRVGHKGAAALAEGNTPPSFDAALESGVDMIEFDVLRDAAGRLVLAHDPADAAARNPVSLDAGLDHLAGPDYVDIELDVDVKHPGFEPELVAALQARGLERRTLVSSTFPVTLERVGTLEPGLRRGLSVPRARRDYLRSVLAPPAMAYMAAVRARLPGRAALLIADGRIEAVMAHWLLVGPRLVSAVHRAGGRVFVWTVDDAERMARLSALGVDGVITNDPRLFVASVGSDELKPGGPTARGV